MEFIIIATCWLLYCFSAYFYGLIATRKHVEPYGLVFVMLFVPIVNTIIVLKNWKYLRKTESERQRDKENFKKLFEK